MEHKRGRLGNSDKDYIKRYSETLTDEEMARDLNRTLDTVRDYRVKYVGKGAGVDAEEAAKVRSDLYRRPEWKYFKEQFSTDELHLFEYNYVHLMSQFKNDVLLTEEKQIFQVIEIEIFLHRNKRQRMLTLEEIERLEKLIKAENKNKLPDKKILVGFEASLVAARSVNSSLTNEYKTLFEKYESVMKTLKGTRDQRIKNIESNKTSFISYLKSLEEAEIRESEGEQMEFMRLATEKEKSRLGEYHEYVDGEVDRPILSADTLGEDDD